jgi:glycosyltransferase involved in cell wall biosynthesis
MTATESSHERGTPEEMSATISVVVPTRNRPESVVRAVRSALDQTFPPHEVVVVIDGPDCATVRVLEDIGDSRVVVLELDENGGAARARNIGVSNSMGDWVAFLDDDDQWLPGKLRAQTLSAASGADVQDLVLATGVEWKGDSTSEWWPLRSPSPQERISDYLFVRRRPGEGLLATPTIMLRRELALACPFPEHLRIHEDYDWFIGLEKAGAHFVVVLEPLVIVNAPSARTSVSSDAQWTTSLSWVLSRKSDMSQRAFSDFCLTVVARLARATGGLRAEAAVFFVACTGRLSWFSTARFLAICLLPAQARRRMAATASTSIRRIRRLVPK